MNKSPSKHYNRQLTPRPTYLSETSADTNFPGKRTHHRVPTKFKYRQDQERIPFMDNAIYNAESAKNSPM